MLNVTSLQQNYNLKEGINEQYIIINDEIIIPVSAEIFGELQKHIRQSEPTTGDKEIEKSFYIDDSLDDDGDIVLNE